MGTNEAKGGSPQPDISAASQRSREKVWVTETPLEYLNKLAKSMPRSIANVLAAKGQHTKY